MTIPFHRYMSTENQRVELLGKLNEARSNTVVQRQLKFDALEKVKRHEEFLKFILEEMEECGTPAEVIVKDIRKFLKGEQA